MFVSIIIPTLNEEDSIKELLQQLQDYRDQGHEVIVVDGGSTDRTVEIAEPLADNIILCQSGRASQMNEGAEQSRFDILWFLHADTSIADNSIETIQSCITSSNNVWGRFNVKLSGTNILFRVIEKMMNLRSCITGIATGDQGVFLKKDAFDSVRGFSNIPLMEDIDLSVKLKKISKPICITTALTTSSRRWEEKGILVTVFLMWKLRFLYWLGVSADKLAELYK